MNDENVKEVWKDVVGYEGLYKVSNLGNVYSNYTHRNLCCGKTQDGYVYASLTKNKHRNNKFVHRLVAEAFIDNPDNLPVVNHKDENPQNNNVCNLEWCSYKYNATYNNAHIKRGDNMSKPVYAYDKNGTLIKKYKSAREAHRETGFSHGDISQCCNGYRYALNDTVWSYVELSVEEVKYKFCCYNKNKIISSNIGNYIKEIKSKKVNQYDLDGNFIKTYNSVNEAGRELKFSPSLISGVCRGEHKYTHQFIFKYEDK